MGVGLPMGADFEKRDLEQSPYLLIVFRDPFPGHKEGGGNFLLDQIVDQRLIVARSVAHWTEVECQCDSGTGGRT